MRKSPQLFRSHHYYAIGHSDRLDQIQSTSNSDCLVKGRERHHLAFERQIVYIPLVQDSHL